MGFDVNVTLSKKAAAKLAAEKEGIIVLIDYYGNPKRSAEKHANEVGQISLEQQDEQVAIPGTGGHAHISGARVDTKRLDWLAGPAKVNVNVVSARKSSSDNLLDCDFIDGALADVRKAPVTLHCYLIEESIRTLLPRLSAKLLYQASRTSACFATTACAALTIAYGSVANTASCAPASAHT